MPALWQSSQRPMYVRTVWVDGFRHAILTHDDPCYLKLSAKRRPHSSASHQKLTTKIRNNRFSYRENDLESCLSRSHLVIEKPINREIQVEKLNLTDVGQSETESEPSSPKTETKLEMSYKPKTNRMPDVKENTELSDRVIQWLDLAGKVDLLKPDVERIAQPRHSWPEIQRRNLIKSKTSADLRAKEVKPEWKTNTPIDRNEIYVPTSANTIETYARLSRHARSAPRHDTKKDNKNMKQIAETRHKVATERNAVHKQYNDMVTMKLIPDVGKVKKQVHIFMPESLTKAASTTSSRTQSLMSQK
ncbi:unnamed protein product [Leptidea sinapis]|uniref:Uncharacterized protein n=1 Tax=Leptidea sinapis TaxID=189913 RepID=A0A5E4PZV7_9NEOP|nr:unnamed protein product [Leptidea sinapis]